MVNKKPLLTKSEIARVKGVAKGLLERLKAGKLKIDNWQEKEQARDGVKQQIFDFLYADETGLPSTYTEEEIEERKEAIFRHVFEVYPKVPSPYYVQGVA